MARLFPRLSRDSKMTCPMSHPPSPETWWFVIKNGAGPQAQLQKDKSNAFSLRMKLVHGSSFRMIAQLRFSGRTGAPGWTRGSGGSGCAGLSGQTGQVGLGRARAGLAGQAWSNNPNSPIFLVFWTNCSKYHPGPNYWSNWAPEGKTPKYLYFWKTLHTVQ